MGIFGGAKNQPDQINGIKFSQSKKGLPITVVLGQGKVQQSLLWMDGFAPNQVSSGGKGGGKGGPQYVYTADGIIGLCSGPVKSIGNVWSGQSWMSNSPSWESITVAAVYAPQYSSMLAADNGVSFANTYSASYTDYGAPAATVLGGTDYAPLTLVPYGTSLTTGEYSVNPASIGTFTVTSCSAAVAGQTTYNGTFTGGTSPYASGASNAYENFRFTIAGFGNAGNNIVNALCSASTAISVTVANAFGVGEVHAATAMECGNTYHFATADIGTNAQVNYAFWTNYFRNSENDIIPSTGVVNIDEGYWYTTPLSVVYENNGNSLDEQQFTVVPYPPTAKGTYSWSAPAPNENNGGAVLHFFVGAGGDFGNFITITWQFQDNQAAMSTFSSSGLIFELEGGAMAQPIHPYMLEGYANPNIFDSHSPFYRHEPAFPGAALGYTGIAYAIFYPMVLGNGGEIQDNSYEVLTPDSYGGTYSSGPNTGQAITDCNIVTLVTRILTDTRWGLGGGPVTFPIAAMDNGVGGTWGGPPTVPGTRLTDSTTWSWSAAQNAFASLVIDGQDTASSVLGKVFEAFQVGAFVSEGLLKLRPYGTQSAAGNGCTYVCSCGNDTYPNNPVVAFDDTCFVKEKDKDPVSIERVADGYNNDIFINWKDRSNQYFTEITEEFVQSAITRFGRRVEDPTDYDFIHTLGAATFAANRRVIRLTSILNAYTATVPFTYSYVEPMDVVTITTSSAWAAGLNNINLAINSLPVRVIKKVDKTNGDIELTFEDSLFAAGVPSIFNKGISIFNTIVNTNAIPGDTIAVLFEPTARLSLFQPTAIKIGACGTSLEWGGCNVWVATSSAGPYLQVGQIESAARIGYLAAMFPSGPDPDTIHALVVNMAENSGSLDAGTTTDADLGNTLCLVDGEYVAYSTCALSGQNQYTMSGYIRRGQMMSVVSTHQPDGLFMRLDQSVFTYTYDPIYAGLTLYFKFQSLNKFMLAPQDLATLTPVAFTVPGVNGGTVDASSGLILGANAFAIGAGPLGWAPIFTEL